jgi:protease-4
VKRKLPFVWRTIRRLLAAGALRSSEWVLTRLGRRKPYAVLLADVGGDLAEQPGESRLLGLLRRQTGDYLGLITLLRWARDDARLRGVLLRCDDLQISWARLQGLRRAIERLRAAGKIVWVQLERAGIREYYLATAADRVWLAPAATLDVTGLSSEAIFLLDALQKAGVRADVVQMGRYKSAGETFARRDMSAPHREMLEGLVDDLFEQIVEAVATGRQLGVDIARDRLGGGPYTAIEARDAALVDAIGYADECERGLTAACGGGASIERGAYATRRGRETRIEALRRQRATLALLHVEGTIKAGESFPGPERARATGAATVIAALAQVRKRADIGAVLLRVASPGGSVLGSDLIWRELVRTREQKPVIVSFGDVAASGGYYVALAATRVFAEAGTITGSIGVVAGKASLRGLYDRLGVRKELVSRGRNAAMYSDYAPLDDAGRERIHAQADAFYRDFVAKVAAARGLTNAASAAAAEGRVWTGRQALARGLVDELGGVEEALAAAKRSIGIGTDEPVTLEYFPKPRRLWKLSVDLNLPGQSALAELAGVVPPLRFVLRERVWAVLPFHLRFF